MSDYEDEDIVAQNAALSNLMGRYKTELARVSAEIPPLRAALEAALRFTTLCSDLSGPVLWTDRHWQEANNVRVLIEETLAQTPPAEDQE